MVAFAIFGWIFLPIVLAAASGVAAYLIHAHILDARWYAAIGRAGGVAYQSFAAAGKSVSSKSVVAASAMAGAQYMQDQMIEQITRRGLTPEKVQQIVYAELCKLFATDPSVSIGCTSSVTATASPGQEATATVSDVPARIDVPKLTAMSLD